MANMLKGLYRRIEQMSFKYPSIYEKTMTGFTDILYYEVIIIIIIHKISTSSIKLSECNSFRNESYSKAHTSSLNPNSSESHAIKYKYL